MTKKSSDGFEYLSNDPDFVPSPDIEEFMEEEIARAPKDPELFDAERLFLWVLGSEPDDDRVIPLPHGPRVHIIGQAPGHQPP